MENPELRAAMLYSSFPYVFNLEENLSTLNKIKDIEADYFISFRQYHLNFSSMSAFLSYLTNKGELKYSVENGKVYYYSNT